MFSRKTFFAALLFVFLLSIPVNAESLHTSEVIFSSEGDIEDTHSEKNSVSNTAIFSFSDCIARGPEYEYEESVRIEFSGTQEWEYKIKQKDGESLLKAKLKEKGEAKIYSEISGELLDVRLYSKKIKLQNKYLQGEESTEEETKELILCDFWQDMCVFQESKTHQKLLGVDKYIYRFKISGAFSFKVKSKEGKWKIKEFDLKEGGN